MSEHSSALTKSFESQTIDCIAPTQWLSIQHSQIQAKHNWIWKQAGSAPPPKTKTKTKKWKLNKNLYKYIYIYIYIWKPSSIRQITLSLRLIQIRIVEVLYESIDSPNINFLHLQDSNLRSYLKNIEYLPFIPTHVGKIPTNIYIYTKAFIC